MGIFKVKESEWESFLPSQFKYSTLNSIQTSLITINSTIISMNEQIDRVDRISGISYNNQVSNITNAIDHMSSIESYVKQSIGDIEDLLDDEFFSRLNDENGALERLQLTADKKYTTKNTLGITEQTASNVYSTTTSNAYMSGQVTGTEYRTTEKEMIGFEDIFTMSNKNSDHRFKGFSGILNEQFELTKKEIKKSGSKETLEFDDYMNSIINAGKFDHTVDKGWKNWASTALDAIGIVSLVSKFTGDDFITGEKYTEGEKDAASLNIVFSIIGFATMGVGKGIQLGGKAVVIYIAGEMAAAITIKATTGLLDEMGAPKWLQGLTSLAAGILISKKVEGFMSSGVRSLDDIVKVGLGNIDDIKKFGIKNVDELIDIGVKNVDDLLKAGVKNSDDLLKLGVKNLDDLAKLGITSIDDLARLGISSTKELKKLGMDSISDFLKSAELRTVGEGVTYKNWNQMKEAYKGSVTEFVKQNKPNRSPDIKKWLADNGSIEIKNLDDGKQIWVYSKKGISVSYYPTMVNGKSVMMPDMSNYLHPNSMFNEVNIGSFSGDRSKDIAKYLKITGLDEIPMGYELHHTIPDGWVQLIKSEEHKIFTHIGGHSLYK